MDESMSDLESSKQSVAFNRLKASYLKINDINEKAEEEIERCHDQIARQASQNHQLQL